CALALAPVHGGDSDDGTLQRLRTTEPVVRAAIDEGRRRSPTLASLVEAIEHSKTLVYVTRAFMLPHRMEGCLEPGTSRCCLPWVWGRTGRSWCSRTNCSMSARCWTPEADTTRPPSIRSSCGSVSGNLAHPQSGMKRQRR